MKNRRMVSSKQHTYKNGFTLIEILIVLAIIAILAAIATNTFSKSKKQTHARLDRQEFLQLSLRLEEYYSNTFSYPMDLSPLVNAKPGSMILTKHDLYQIYYETNSSNSYRLVGKLNTQISNIEFLPCHHLIIDSNGKLDSFDANKVNNNEICWKH